MLRILEAQAPAKQTATDTISTLCSRLQSASLLEDRRAAILGLRSFAKTYPASVASGALRDLISSLRQDGEDLETTKAVLETLLMLFDPDSKSPEASDEIALWLADEFTQRQDNITVLLDLLETRDFYSRLYSLQLISHISSARPDRTQECIFTASLGVSRLVRVLDDGREAVRNEALLLLVALTPSSTELQKVVAFENAFDRIFAIIDADGSLTHGSVTVRDCLSLLANLLKLNHSNQSYFRETGCISKLAKLLADVTKEQDSEDRVPEWAEEQRDMSLWGLLTIVQLFLTKGGVGTSANQVSFWQHGIMQHILYLAFTSSFSTSLKAKSLTTCADIVRGNTGLQERFGDLTVSLGPQTKSPNNKPINGVNTTNVIQALLEIILTPAPAGLLDVRLSACECVKAFFFGHSAIRSHFLRRAIEGHQGGDDEIPNILTVLIHGPDSRGVVDPYQSWMASVLLFHLIHDDSESKSVAMRVTEGDAANGEEVITCVQAIAGNLVAAMQKGDDERICIGYLMLLCSWLFEDPDVVNDFLGEGSSVQRLIQAIEHGSVNKPLIPGLCAALLGIVYEFSSKDSPISRTTLHQLLTSRLGREQFVEKITKLREYPAVRDFEVLPQSSGSGFAGGLPEVYFDKTFVEFLKDNFSRIIRAIDREPGLEIPVITNGIQKGISRELVDSLRAQVDDRTQSLQQLESEMLNLQRNLEQERLDHRKTKESDAVELARIKQINESLQTNHEGELREIEQKEESSRTLLLRQHQEQLRVVDSQLKQFSADKERQATKIRERNEGEIADLKATITKLEAGLEKTRMDHVQDLQTAHEEYSSNLSSVETRAQRAEDKLEEANAQTRRVMQDLQEAQRAIKKVSSELEETKAARKDLQTELDDLFIVFGDLEAKRARDKHRLKDLGESVSEGEDEEGEGESPAAENENLD